MPPIDAWDEAYRHLEELHGLLAASEERAEKAEAYAKSCVESMAAEQRTASDNWYRAETAEASLKEAVRIFKDPEMAFLHSHGFPSLAHQVDAFLLRQKKEVPKAEGVA